MEEQKQIRLTLEDTLNAQAELKQLISKVRDASKPMSTKERSQLYELLPKALLSQGCEMPCGLKLKNRIITFESLQTMAIRLSELTTNYVAIKVVNPEPIDDVVPIDFFWKYLYDKLLYLFPNATAEATRISAEQLKRIQQGLYEFTAKESV